MMDRVAGSEAETRLANFKNSGQQDNTQRGTFPPSDVNVPYICRILCQVSWGKAREPCLFFFFPCSKRNRQMGHSDSGCHSSCPATDGLWNSWCSSQWHKGVWKAECRLRHSITMRPQCLASCWKGEPPCWIRPRVFFIPDFSSPVGSGQMVPGRWRHPSSWPASGKRRIENCVWFLSIVKPFQIAAAFAFQSWITTCHVTRVWMGWTASW